MTETLSIDQAIGVMNDAPEENPAVETEAPVEAASFEGEEIEAQPEAESDDEPETVAEVESEEQEPETVIDAPHFWSAERKADFAKLPVELQQYVLESDKQAQRTVSQKLEEAANIRKGAEAQAELLKGLSERISTAAEQAEDTFSDRWSQFTPEAWLKLAQSDPNRYTQLKAQHDAESAIIQQTRAAKDAASKVEQARWVSEQEEALKTLAPELSDPVKGAANRGALSDYLISQGVPEQALSNVDALTVSIAWKAMQYDKSRTALKTKPPVEKAPVRPAATPSQSPQSSALAKAEARLRNTGSVEDAIRYLNAKG